MIPVLMVPSAAAVYGAYKLYQKYSKTDEEKRAEENATLYLGVGVASLAAIYIGYKASGAGDDK